MTPTPPPKLEAYIFFDNQTDRPVFIRLFPENGTLRIVFSDFDDKGALKIDTGRIFTVHVDRKIRECLHGGKLRVNFQYHIRRQEPPLQMTTPGPIRDLLGRARGPVFRFTVHTD